MVQAGGSALQPSINHRSRKIWHSTSWHTSKGQKETLPASFHRCSSRILPHRHQPGHSGWQGAMPFGSKDKSLGKKSSLLLLKSHIPCFLALPKAMQCTEIVVTCECSPPMLPTCPARCARLGCLVQSLMPTGTGQTHRAAGGAGERSRARQHHMTSTL